MALTFVGDSNPVSGTTSATADTGAITGGGAPLAVNDHVFLHIANKRPAVTPSTPAGWTLVGSSVQVGSGTPGAGDGPLRITVFYRKWQSGDTIPAVANSGTGAAIQAALVIYRGVLGDSLTFATASGSDTTDATGWSVTGGSTIAFAVDDVLLAFSGITSTGPNFQTPVLSATGITFDTIGNPYSTSTGNGDDLRSACHRVAVTAGSATIAPVMTDTLTQSGVATGGVLFVRVRQVLPLTITKTGSGAAKGAGAGPKVVEALAPIEKTGSAIAGTTGNALPLVVTHATTREKAGAGGLRGAATGTRQHEMPRTGAGAVAGAGHAPAPVVQVTVISKAGSAAAKGAGSGPRQRDRVETGSGAARGAGSGVRAITHPIVIEKTGGAAGRTAGTGKRNAEWAETGGGGLFHVGSGQLLIVHPTTHEKAGGGVARMAGAGPGVAELGRVGGGLARCAGTGSKVVQRSRAGTGFARGAGSGPRVRTRVGAPALMTGGGASRGAATGSLEITHGSVITKTGGGAGKGAGAGGKAVVATTFHVKTGGAAARGAGSGRKRVPQPASAIPSSSASQMHVGGFF